MVANEQTLKTATQYAANFDFDIMRYSGIYKDYVAYYVTSKALEGTISGFPNFVLVREDYSCRLVTPEEALEIMALKNQFVHMKIFFNFANQNHR